MQAPDRPVASCPHLEQTQRSRQAAPCPSRCSSPSPQALRARPSSAGGGGSAEVLLEPELEPDLLLDQQGSQPRPLLLLRL